MRILLPLLSLSILACAGLPRGPDPAVADPEDWRPAGLAEAPWQAGLQAWSRGVAAGSIDRPTLVIGDLSRPSEQQRLWVVDLEARTAWRTRVAHGSGSGGRWAGSFSNEEGSHQTSLGLYRGGEVYHGKHGRSLRLDGLDASNDAARQRAIVVHAADYVGDGFVAEHGRAGRSWGCPAVDPHVSDGVIDALRGGGALVLWAPTP